MVLLIAGDHAAATPQGRALLEALDLSAGHALAAQVCAHWPLARRRIKVRKRFVRLLLEQVTAGLPAGLHQLVSAGAGLSPLALDWCVRHPDGRAFEIDLHNMPAKQAALAEVAPASVHSRIRCIDCDLNDPSRMLTALRDAGWRAGAPSVWVLEGIAYYMAQERLASLVRAALAADRSARAIVEFGGPQDALDAAAREETAAFHAAIGSAIGAQSLTTVNLDSLAASAGAEVLHCHDLAAMEAQLNIDRVFRGPQDSAMRIALLAPPQRTHHGTPHA